MADSGFIPRPRPHCQKLSPILLALTLSFQQTILDAWLPLHGRFCLIAETLQSTFICIIWYKPQHTHLWDWHWSTLEGHVRSSTATRQHEALPIMPQKIVRKAVRREGGQEAFPVQWSLTPLGFDHVPDLPGAFWKTASTLVYNQKKGKQKMCLLEFNK